MSGYNPWSVQAIIDRIERERRQTPQAEPTTSATAPIGYAVRGLWSCHTDPGDLTAARAHRAMQVHLACGRNLLFGYSATFLGGRHALR